MFSNYSEENSLVMGGQNPFDSFSAVLGGLEDIRFRLQKASTKQKIDALLDALQYGQKGIELVTQALSDRHREVRQSAFLLLSDLDEAVARKAVGNYLPFEKMQCFHTLTEFNSNYCDSRNYPPDYFAIADYNNTLVCYWDMDYKRSFINIWSLETGKRKSDFDLAAHEFGMGKQGKVGVFNYQELLWAIDTETQKEISTYSDGLMCDRIPNSRCLAVCPTKQSLFVTGSSRGWVGEFEIWNYETHTRHLHYQFQDMILSADWKSGNLSKYEDWRYKISPFLFTPDGKFLVVRFRGKKHSILQLWDLELKEHLQTLDELSLLTVNSLAIRPDGEILACGMREDKVCVWELRSDRILDSFPYEAPCLMSSDGRVLIYCTNNYEIVFWDLVMKRELCTLQGHSAPIIYVAMSRDREFIASYSADRSIKIWGIPEPGE